MHKILWHVNLAVLTIAELYKLSVDQDRVVYRHMCDRVLERSGEKPLDPPYKNGSRRAMMHLLLLVSGSGLFL